MEHVQLPTTTTTRSSSSLSEQAWIPGARGIRRARPAQADAPLANDREFRAREKRLRLVYAHTSGPDEGVAVLEVLRDSAAADSLSRAGGKAPGP
jgi:hypothetical protein